MKSLVVGYGSIGRRHAEILAMLGHEVAVVSRRDIDFRIVYRDIETAINEFKPDYAVVASKTNEHASDVEQLDKHGFKGKLIVEKPLTHQTGFKPPAGIAELYVAYNLRFHPAVVRFRDLVRKRETAAAYVYVGQYLPDWRPDIDYRSTHSAHRSEGGGALRELSHELDYVSWIFGGWTRLTALGGQLSGLEIDSDDNYALLIETGDCPLVSVAVNYLDSTLRRFAIAHTDCGTIRLDLVEGTVTHGETTEKFEVGRNDTYINQHLAALNSQPDNLCSLSDGINIVEMIAAAERASAKRLWVSNPDLAI